MRHPQHWYFPQFRCYMRKISAKRYRRARLGSDRQVLPSVVPFTKQWERWLHYNYEESKLRLQTTIDFLIHLSYKTGHIGGLYKIPWSSNSKINHFIWIIMISSHCKKNMNIGSSLNFWELGPFLRGTLSSATCRTIGTIKTYFILSLNDNIISHQE